MPSGIALLLSVISRSVASCDISFLYNVSNIVHLGVGVMCVFYCHTACCCSVFIASRFCDKYFIL